MSLDYDYWGAHSGDLVAWRPVFEYCLDHFWGRLGVHFPLNINPKTNSFFERLLELSGAILEAFLAFLVLYWEAWNAILAQLLQQFWHIFKKDDIRYLRCLGWLLDAMLAQVCQNWIE